MFMHLTRELARAERLKSEVSLLVMDLDNFKDINDTYGHHVGDRALRDVAGVLRTGIRPYDICVRYAGDEFIVVLSGAAARRRSGSGWSCSAPSTACSSRRGRARRCRSRSASARRSSRTTAIRTKRCWRPPTAGCTATRRGASAQRPPARASDVARADAIRRRSRNSTSSARRSACSRLTD